MKFTFLLALLAFLGQAFTTSAKVKVERNIDYSGKVNNIRTQLNVFHKTKVDTAQDVIIFIHGGSWSTGKKETYWWLGRNFARKGVVTVILNYSLAPNYKYEQMATDCAAAVKWTVNNIKNYGGNPKRIFLMGHSAGAHLAELINADPKYFKAAGLPNPIKGMILDDAFGLDMNEYLTKAEKDANYDNFIRTFSADPAIWTKGSPLNYVSYIRNPHLIFYGEKTYPAIQIQSERLNKILTDHKIRTEMHVIKNKKHVGMISQMIFGWNKLYKYSIDFIKRN
ncbi:alpha/beta hydrolase [Pedobacter metabolipauper]|uniref:Alpha/beta hydrolase family protein n=1 Tax=Pedobacter metabolipauper TaxID=425513 RepID=A0A4R6STD0_9SPHI|nr:alpha/beta hydrolase [Pedobacter metabolipauper]TDQ08173.1 alpha/beta hydrolase family protein [Pedobacter metabolipauper]